MIDHRQPTRCRGGPRCRCFHRPRRRVWSSRLRSLALAVLARVPHLLPTDSRDGRQRWTTRSPVFAIAWGRPEVLTHRCCSEAAGVAPLGCGSPVVAGGAGRGGAVTAAGDGCGWPLGASAAPAGVGSVSSKPARSGRGDRPMFPPPLLASAGKRFVLRHCRRCLLAAAAGGCARGHLRPVPVRMWICPVTRNASLSGMRRAARTGRAADPAPGVRRRLLADGHRAPRDLLVADCLAAAGGLETGWWCRCATTSAPTEADADRGARPQRGWCCSLRDPVGAAREPVLESIRRALLCRRPTLLNMRSSGTDPQLDALPRQSLRVSGRWHGKGWPQNTMCLRRCPHCR